MEKALNLVNYDIEIEFIDRLPEDYVNLLHEAEEYDKTGDYGMYFNDVDAIDIGAKMLCMNGVISEYEWRVLLSRYRL